MLRFAIVLSVSAMCLAGVAMADEVISTHSTQGPVAEASATALQPDPAQAKRQADGDWARGVLAGTSDDKDGTGSRDRDGQRPCRLNSDGKQHGEVWAGVGTGGYNTAGVVVTQPIGDCGELTVAASHTDYGNVRRRGGHR